nr:immunoglobulin heavy chain junction region [Macaca mulatta]
CAKDGGPFYGLDSW